MTDQTLTPTLWDPSPAEAPRGKRETRRLIGNAARRRKKMIAFGWYGGKFVHLDFILPHLPMDAEHFCDVYGGSAAVLINRVPAKVETYNDLDTELVNFFAVLRDQPDDLIRSIGLTPFSREELAKACGSSENLPPLERARPVLCSGAADPHGTGPNEQRRALGTLRPDFQSGYGGRCVPLAGCG